MRVLKNLFTLFIFAVLLGTTIWMYVNFFHSSDKIEAEYYVLEKQSEKGMFFAPLYAVITDRDKTSHYVSKRQFDALKFGDVIAGHETHEYGFFTKRDQLYEGALLIFLIAILGGMFIFLLFNCIVSIPIVDRAIQKRVDRRKQQKKEKKRKWLGMTILIIALLFACVYVLLVSLNLFHKLLPINQTATTAHIIDREYDLNIKADADYSTYELTVVFYDQEDNMYQVKKGVSSQTYHQHEYKNAIDIKYRNKNPYDIFIDTENPGELIGALTNVNTVLYILSFVIFYFLGKHLKRRGKASYEEDLA